MMKGETKTKINLKKNLSRPELTRLTCNSGHEIEVTP
jgi:intein/homing endonuclease